jgi:hypothetical protein
MIWFFISCLYAKKTFGVLHSKQFMMIQISAADKNIWNIKARYIEYYR